MHVGSLLRLDSVVDSIDSKRKRKVVETVERSLVDFGEKKMFIHIPKNGGMTIRSSRVMREKIMVATPPFHVSPEYTNGLHRTMRLHGEHPGNEHARWIDWDENVRKNNKAFAIVRNPWSRVVSRYEFARKVIYKEKTSDHYGETDYIKCDTFENFLESRHIWGEKEYFWHRAVRGWFPAFHYVTDLHDNVVCDILRFEHFNEDVKTYLGVIFNPEPRNVTGYKQSTYKDYYNDKTIQIIADWYQEDIDQWGFDFDTGATKNYFMEFKPNRYQRNDGSWDE